jgi:AraC-like DNA-binding protein
LLIAFSLRLGTIPTWNPEALSAHPWLFPLTTPLPFLFGPLLFWYARELTHEEPSPLPLLPLHFAPYLLGTALAAVAVFGRDSGVVARVFAGHPPAWMLEANLAKVIVNVVYVALAAGLVFGPASRRTGAQRRLWGRALVVTSTATLLPYGFVALYPAASAGLTEGVTFPFVMVAAAMALLIYTFSALVLLAPEDDWQHYAGPRGHADHARELHDSHSMIPTEECERLAALAHKRLAAGAFRDAELSLGTLARELEVHPNRLSRSVNETFHLSFRALLNRCRLDYFIRRVRAGALDYQTILELAFEAGFPSKSTFNRVFKEETGTSPSAFAERAGRPHRPVPTRAAGLARNRVATTMPHNGTTSHRLVQ